MLAMWMNTSTYSLYRNISNKNNNSTNSNASLTIEESLKSTAKRVILLLKEKIEKNTHTQNNSNNNKKKIKWNNFRFSWLLERNNMENSYEITAWRKKNKWMKKPDRMKRMKRNWRQPYPKRIKILLNNKKKNSFKWNYKFKFMISFVSKRVSIMLPLFPFSFFCLFTKNNHLELHNQLNRKYRNQINESKLHWIEARGQKEMGRYTSTSIK